MKILCPTCRQQPPPEQINVSTDLAFCPRCNEGFAISGCIDEEAVNPEALQHPPKGAWYRKEMDRTIIGATTRSPVAFFLVPFMCVWSGGSIGGIYGSQIASGNFNLGASLFGIPFLLGTVVLVSFALMAVCGKVELSIGRESTVFIGVGKLGWTRRFDWRAVQTITENWSQVNYPGSNQNAIVLEGKERIKFGTGLNEARRYFILNALKYLKAHRY
jgi:hypothetical protein